MAHVRNNAVTEGLRGMLGNRLVFRSVRGKTIVSNRPKAPHGQSQQQRENRIHFRCASRLAQAALQDPQRKQYYTLKARRMNLPNAYTAALTDHLRKPTVSRVKQSHHNGTRISITTLKKDFALSTVEVSVTNTRGEILITHPAFKNDHKRNEWIAVLPKELYVRNEGNNTAQPCHLRVSVKDRAGNAICIHQPFTAMLN